jgi:hypothetical protein
MFRLIVADFADPAVNQLMPTLYKLIFSGVEFEDIQDFMKKSLTECRYLS